ncbi:MAG: HNH endonuclease [Nostoc sp.]|uniref:HNH endonuclease n=1 Tax=Nostoc sp. TaxID=1180 RepID=UPI002FF7D26A
MKFSLIVGISVVMGIPNYKFLSKTLDLCWIADVLLLLQTKSKTKLKQMNSKQKYNKKQQLIDLYGHNCWWCGHYITTDKVTIEHLFPKSRGGSNSLENLRLACLTCNRSRGNSLFPPGWKKANCV